MPIFTYRCSKCGEEFEILVGVSSHAEELKCKKCGSKNVKKLFSPFGIKSSSGGASSSSCPTGTCPLT